MMTVALAGAVVRPKYRGAAEASRKAKKYRLAEEECRRNNETKAARLYHNLYIVHRNLAQGHSLISVNKAMEVAGVKPTGHPVLAIANAAARWCWFFRDGGKITDNDDRWMHPACSFVSDFADNPGWNKERDWERTSPSEDRRFRFLAKHFPVRMNEERIAARVPVVPPELLPKDSLHNYCILWEADWQHAPKDPLLLKRVNREYYRILAEWNLTSIERLVLEMAAYAGE